MGGLREERFGWSGERRIREWRWQLNEISDEEGKKINFRDKEESNKNMLTNKINYDVIWP